MKDLKGKLVIIGMTAAGVAAGMMVYGMWTKAAADRAADKLAAKIAKAALDATSAVTSTSSCADNSTPGDDGLCADGTAPTSSFRGSARRRRR